MLLIEEPGGDVARTRGQRSETVLKTTLCVRCMTAARQLSADGRKVHLPFSPRSLVTAGLSARIMSRCLIASCSQESGSPTVCCSCVPMEKQGACHGQAGARPPNAGFSAWYSRVRVDHSWHDAAKLESFRSHYPLGDEYVVCPCVDVPFTIRRGSRNITVCSLVDSPGPWTCS